MWKTRGNRWDATVLLTFRMQQRNSTLSALSITYTLKSISGTTDNTSSDGTNNRIRKDGGGGCEALWLGSFLGRRPKRRWQHWRGTMFLYCAPSVSFTLQLTFSPFRRLHTFRPQGMKVVARCLKAGLTDARRALFLHAATLMLAKVSLFITWCRADYFSPVQRQRAVGITVDGAYNTEQPRTHFAE